MLKTTSALRVGFRLSFTDIVTSDVSRTIVDDEFWGVTEG